MRLLASFPGFCSIGLLVLAVSGCGELDNPPVREEPAWDSPRTRELAARACFQCHSNETEWAWYSYLPGVSAMLSAEVHEARSRLNFSEWDRPQEEHNDAAEKILEQEMPPGGFLTVYPHRGLSDDERDELAAGLRATFAADPPPGGDDDDD